MRNNVVKLDVAKNPVKKANPLRSLLVPIDLTPGTDRLLARLALLPLADNARVTLVHVVPKGLSRQEERSAQRDAARVLASEAHHLHSALPRSVAVDTSVRVGSPAKEIAACGRAAKAELIVMGRGVGRAVRDALLGSTAERVLRQSKLPVLVVRLPARAPYRRPALALDFDDAARAALKMSLRALAEPRPAVMVVHAFHAPYQHLSYPSLGDDYARERKAQLQLASTQKLAKLIESTLKSSGTTLDWRAHVRNGFAQAVIEKAARDHETDLLVLGTQAYTGLAHMFLGTVAGDVLREVKCDVLVVPPSSAKG